MRLNTTPRAIRFYEEKGLIFPKKDKENDYRYFTENDVVRLSTILALREVGLGLERIKDLLENSEMSINEYLNLQRSALFEQWLELKDMITTIDQMIGSTEDEKDDMEAIFKLANQLKKLKDSRKNWEDKWEFDDWADEYENYIKKDGYVFNVHQDYDDALEKVAEVMELKHKSVCLDIGIGTGNLGSKFIARGVHVIGVDQSEKMLQTCNGKYPEIETRKGHFLALPLLDHSVDGIVSSYALHHLPDKDKLLALEEMNRVLKENGQICIADLMFQNEDHRSRVIDAFRSQGNIEAVQSIEDEFYGDRSLLVKWLEANSYQVETHQFNDILSMIYAKK